jgi:hypothetical protein
VEGLRNEEERGVRVSLGFVVEAEAMKVRECGSGCDESLSFVEEDEEIETAMVELK